MASPSHGTSYVQRDSTTAYMTYVTDSEGDSGNNQPLINWPQPPEADRGPSTPYSIQDLLKSERICVSTLGFVDQGGGVSCIPALLWCNTTFHCVLLRLHSTYLSWYDFQGCPPVDKIQLITSSILLLDTSFPSSRAAGPAQVEQALIIVLRHYIPIYRPW